MMRDDENERNITDDKTEITDLDDDSIHMADETAPLGFLIVKSPVKYRGRVYKLLPGTVIGRKDADVLINDRRVSRQHARLNLEQDAVGRSYYELFDFGTPNGTYVNGVRISQRTPIEENDELKMGDHVFVFKTLGE
jgi:pSer/pThr/pTyr-binding forkhead associated (FHA) protein